MTEITDNQRREVAARLRGFAEDGSPADVIYGGTEAYDQMLVRVLRQIVGKGDLFEKLNALSHAVDAVTVLLAVQATPGGRRRSELLDKAEEYGRLREESDERAIGYAEKVNKIWGAGCDE